MEIEVSQGKYKVYHIPGKKIGCTKNIKKRVEEEQGYNLVSMRYYMKQMI